MATAFLGDDIISFQWPRSAPSSPGPIKQHPRRGLWPIKSGPWSKTQIWEKYLICPYSEFQKKTKILGVFQENGVRTYLNGCFWQTAGRNVKCKSFVPNWISTTFPRCGFLLFATFSFGYQINFYKWICKRINCTMHSVASQGRSINIQRVGRYIPD